LLFGHLESKELRLALRLTAVVAMRMLGLFLVLPVFMLLAVDLPGYTPALAGVAIGVYGLTQAMLQQPFGRLSDYWGRRRVILLGLALFIAGSVVAATAGSLYALIAGRALQGCGAIAGVTLAFAADHTRAAQRPTVMALIGMGIGAAFLLSIMVSVPLASAFGLRGLFWLTGLFGVVAVLLVLGTPGGRPERPESLQDSGTPAGILPLCISVFLLHALMTLFFVVLPGLLVERHALELTDHWKVYVPTMLVSALLVFPMLRLFSGRNLENRVLVWAFVALAASFILFGSELGWPALVFTAILYFAAFSLLEAVMPAMVSHLAPETGRGRKMGLYTSFQFLGAFAGGAAGGWLLQVVGPGRTLAAAAGASLLWAGLFRFLPVRRWTGA